MMRSLALFLPDFLLSVAATSLEDARLDSQVQWKQTIHSIKVKSFYSSCATKLEIESADCRVRRASETLKWQLRMKFYSLFVRHNACAPRTCVSQGGATLDEPERGDVQQ
jgi:hypothetical protein